MNSINFTGLDGKTYAIPAPHEFGSDYPIPEIHHSATAADIVTHVMLIVASRPPYIRAGDVPWLLAYLQNFREFVLSHPYRSYDFAYYEALSGLSDSISVAKMAFAIDLVIHFTNGFWIESGQSKPMRIFEDYVYENPFPSFDRRTKGVLTSEHFGGHIYECRVPAGVSVKLFKGGTRAFQEGDTFYFIQDRFHGSESRLHEGYAADIEWVTCDPLALDGFSIPGRILIALDGDEFCRRNSAEIPIGWAKSSGWDIQRLKGHADPAMIDPDAGIAEIDLMMDSRFATSLNVSQYQNQKREAINYLKSVEGLGLNTECLRHLTLKYNAVDLARSCKELISTLSAARKVSQAKLKEFVLACPVLFNLIPTEMRKVSWLKFRQSVFENAWLAIALSGHNMCKAEVVEFYTQAQSVSPYPLRLIPPDYHCEAAIIAILPDMTGDDFLDFDTKMITRKKLEEYYGENYLRDFRGSCALDAIPNLFAHFEEEDFEIAVSLLI